MTMIATISIGVLILLLLSVLITYFVPELFLLSFLAEYAFLFLPSTIAGIIWGFYKNWMIAGIVWVLAFVVFNFIMVI